MKNVETIELSEYVTKRIPEESLTRDVGELLWKQYSKQVAIEFPTFKTENMWELTSQGWVGYIPLPNGLGLSLLPKVPLGNLFKMLEYAYRLKSFRFLNGLVECETLEDFFSRLARLLATLVLERNKRGFYRNYVERAEELPYIVGRMQARSLIKRWNVNVKCNYHELVTDIDDNQILAWTLYKIARSGMCSEEVLPIVRKAYRSLHSSVTLTPFKGSDCISRLYNRLNLDYQSMHALCRFFLDQSGPSYKDGDTLTLPFLVDMARLYELFIAEWMKVHLPTNFEVKAQERFNVSDGGEISFAIDLVIYDSSTGAVKWVIDTKYKISDLPSSSDISQVVTYALAKNSKEAVLLYPTTQIKPYCQLIGDIRVRTIGFDVAADIDSSGKMFIEQLLRV